LLHRRDTQTKEQTTFRRVTLPATSHHPNFPLRTTPAHATKAKKTIMSAEEVANAFIAHYYQAFDANADQLAGLYVSIGCVGLVVEY